MLGRELKVGDRVRDVYTKRTGKVVAVEAITNRCTVDLGEYKMTGCQSWFEAIEA